MTDDEVMVEAAYDEGLVDGMGRQYQKDRAAAFGAIRRAAEVARSWDRAASQYDNFNMVAFNETVNVSTGIREAIRAAIGSEATS